MVKCNVNKNKNSVWVKGSGTAEAMTTETLMVIQQLYQNIRQQNPEAAKGYKENIIGVLLDPRSPVWKE